GAAPAGHHSADARDECFRLPGSDPNRLGFRSGAAYVANIDIVVAGFERGSGIDTDRDIPIATRSTEGIAADGCVAATDLVGSERSRAGSRIVGAGRIRRKRIRAGGGVKRAMVVSDKCGA